MSVVGACEAVGRTFEGVGAESSWGGDARLRAEGRSGRCGGGGEFGSARMSEAAGRVRAGLTSLVVKHA